MSLAALSAYQAVVLVPILVLYARKNRPGGPFYAVVVVVAALTPVVVIGLWQIYERLTSGALPASVLAGYMSSYQVFAQKLKNAGALTVHLGWIVFPILSFAAFGRRARVLILIMMAAAIYDRNPLFWLSIAAGAGVLIWCAEHWRDFLAQWILLFFAAALVIFFAGSARYLLPIALPVAILAPRQLSRKWPYAGVAFGGPVSLPLAMVNYRHWHGYREFASTLAKETQTKPVWV